MAEINRFGNASRTTVIKQVRSFLKSGAGKLSTWGPLNYLGTNGPMDILFLYLPDHQLIKLSTDDLTSLIVDGEKALPLIVQKSKLKVVTQSTYHSTRSGLNRIFLGAFAFTVGKGFYDRHREKKTADKKMVEEDDADWAKIEENKIK